MCGTVFDIRLATSTYYVNLNLAIYEMYTHLSGPASLMLLRIRHG